MYIYMRSGKTKGIMYIPYVEMRASSVWYMMHVCFTLNRSLNRSFYPSTLSTPVSVPINPRNMQALWSQNYGTETTPCCLPLDSSSKTFLENYYRMLG